MNVLKQVDNHKTYPGTHIKLTSKGIGTIEICHQQHKVPFYKQNMLKEHFLLFAMAGSNELLIGRQRFLLKGGDMLLIKKRSNVEIIKSGDELKDFMYESVSFTLETDIIIDFIKLIEVEGISRKPVVGDEIIVHRFGQRLKLFLESLKPYFKDNKDTSAGLFKVKILELLYDLSHENPGFLRQLINLGRHETRDLAKVMEKHCYEPHTLKELAKHSGMSLSGFQREFQFLYQTTPAKWVQKKRLQKAKMLFISTMLTVETVCYEVGYENPSHFSRLYKRHFGFSPGETKSKLSDTCTTL